RLLRRRGSFDLTPATSVKELDVWLLEGETIRPDAARLFRSRPPNYQNPLAERDGQPGVAFRWLEVEGPVYDEWPTAGHKLLFGDLPMVNLKAVVTKPERSTGETNRFNRERRFKPLPGVEVVSKKPMADAE